MLTAWVWDRCRDDQGPCVGSNFDVSGIELLVLKRGWGGELESLICGMNGILLLRFGLECMVSKFFQCLFFCAVNAMYLFSYERQSQIRSSNYTDSRAYSAHTSWTYYISPNVLDCSSSQPAPNPSS